MPLIFGDAEGLGQRTRTRREIFLAEMEQVVPWKALLKLDEDAPYCFSPRTFTLPNEGIVIEDNGRELPDGDDEVFLATSAEVATTVLALARKAVAEEVLRYPPPPLLAGSENGVLISAECQRAASYAA